MIKKVIIYEKEVLMRYVLIFLILFSFTFSLQGSSGFSLKSGFNLSTAEFNDPDMNIMNQEKDYKLGFLLYGTWYQEIYKGFYLEVEAGLNQKGGGNDKENTYIHFYSLELPLLLGYSILENLNIYFGGYLSKTILITTDGGIFSNNTNEFYGSDMGFLFGGEYIYKNYSFNIRYQRGVNKLRKESYETSIYYDANQQFVFMVGYRFF